jgi:hypothetical protein
MGGYRVACMDRKEMVRRYRETPPPAGVFRVRHKASGRIMIGASPDAPARPRRVQAQLEMNSHPIRQLQDDWDSDGETGFEFEVLDLLPKPEDSTADIEADLDALLDMWVENLAIDGTATY